MAEISFVNSLDTCKANRIDSEYYRKTVLDKINAIEKHENKKLSELADFVIGPFGSTVKVEQYVANSEYKYVRNKDINDFIIKDDDQICLPPEVYYSLPKYHIQENDLIMTVLGTLGKVSIATKKDTKSIFSCKNTLIRATNINPFYLLTYLNTNTGGILSIRGKRGIAQEFLNLTDLKEIDIFVPSIDFQLEIEKIVKKSFHIGERARKEKYDAQRILLQEIGLSDKKINSHDIFFTKKYSDTARAERIDAEYFQPKYDNIIDAIKAYSGGYDTLGDLCKTSRGSLIPESYYDEKNGMPYIRGADFSSGILEKNKIVFINDRFLPSNEKKVKESDIVFSLIGSVGATAIVTQDFSGSYISNNTGKISCGDEINAESLQILLSSVVGEMYFAKYMMRTAQPKISDKDVDKFIIPILSKSIQKTMHNKISLSFQLKEESKQLLEIAKRAVEIAIEKDEKEALKWLESQEL